MLITKETHNMQDNVKIIKFNHADELKKWVKKQTNTAFTITTHARDLNYTHGIIAVKKPAIMQFCDSVAYDRTKTSFEAHICPPSRLEKRFTKSPKSFCCIFPVYNS